MRDDLETMRGANIQVCAVGLLGGVTETVQFDWLAWVVIDPSGYLDGRDCLQIIRKLHPSNEADGFDLLIPVSSVEPQITNASLVSLWALATLRGQKVLPRQRGFVTL